MHEYYFIQTIKQKCIRNYISSNWKYVMDIEQMEFISLHVQLTVC